MKGVIRPKMAVLPDSARIPRENLVEPPPTRFTHAVTIAQAYYYESRRSAPAAGTFAPGTRVVLLSADTPSADRPSANAPLCRVVDGRGLSVFTACVGLEPLPRRRSRIRKKK